MSFSIDLWNGSNIIKTKYNNLRQKYRSFNNFLIKYNTVESQHCKNLDYLYNEFKEQNKKNSYFESARINIIENINYESELKKNFIENVNEIIKKINLFLQELKNRANETSDLTENFVKELEKLNSKKEIFYLQCKEMSSLISQYELENNLEDKSNEQKLNKVLSKLIKTRDEYLININEANIKRNIYITKISELLDKYEKEHKEILDSFCINLTDFKTKKYEMLNLISEREKNELKNIFSKLNTDKEIMEFVIRNATKEFPIIQIEFSPFKNKDFEAFLNSKYQNRLKQNDLKRIISTINKYFKKNNVFPLNYVQTGISRINKQPKENFFNYRRFSLFIKNNNNENNSENSENIKEKELEIIKNYELIKNIINELLTENKVQIFDESHLVYIEALIKTLSFLRSKGYLEINEQNYNIFTDIFRTILDQNKDNDYILKNLLILSQTFYKIEEGEKIYIQEGIREIPVLIMPKTWHRCINYSLKYSNKDIKFNSLKEYLEKIDRDAYSTVITYLCDLKTFTDNEKCYQDVSYFYSKIYKIKEEEIKATVEKSMKSRKRLKETKTNEIKNDNKNEEDEIKNEEENKENNTNNNEDKEKIENEEKNKEDNKIEEKKNKIGHEENKNEII